MNHSYINPQWKNDPSDEEHLTLARQRFELPHALHDIVLVRVLTDDANRPQSTHYWHIAQQVAVDCWYTQAKEYDAQLNINRRWIPYKCVFLPDTEAGRKFQDLAQSIGQVPMQAGIKPKNQNQGYWLKTLHHIYQAKGLLIANNIFSLLSGDNHPRKLLQDSVGHRETRKFEQLAAADAALYRLIQAVAPSLELASSSANDERLVIQLLVDIQQQTFIDDWNAGPANSRSTWIPLKAQTDWQVKLTHFLKKLIDKAKLLPREKEYLEELARTGTYWDILNAAISSDQADIEESYEHYVKAFVAGKPACIHDISWHRGQPHKLERDYERAPLLPDLKRCSDISAADCDCPFRFIGTNLDHYHCLTHLDQAIERDPPRRANTPQPIIGTINVHGLIIWLWGKRNKTL